MSYFRQFPWFSIFALISSSLAGCAFASIAAYINYLSWISDGTQGMSQPIQSAVGFGLGAAPIVACISLIIGLPTLLIVKRLTIKHLVVSVVSASSAGILALLGGSWYWGSVILCFGLFTALSANIMLLKWQSRSNTVPN